ncbi:MAG: hypothetical protein R2932_60065 [Caldilineaceae bacterium]
MKGDALARRGRLPTLEALQLFSSTRTLAPVVRVELYHFIAGHSTRVGHGAPLTVSVSLPVKGGGGKGEIAQCKGCVAQPKAKGIERSLLQST